MGSLQAVFEAAAQLVALAIQGAAILVISLGGVEALVGFFRLFVSRGEPALKPRDIWLRFASWIVLSLEFTLGADVIGTAISPSWNDIGKLAAIAAIRTALSWFLSRDIDEVKKLRRKATTAATSASS